MEHTEITRAAFVLYAEWGTDAEAEADGLAAQLSALGAEPAATIWRQVASAVRLMRIHDAPQMLQ